MNQENTFSYKYSSKENEEVQKIRKKYLPQGENKLDELKRLDEYVQKSGVMESLCVGIGSSLLFGLGMCLAMQVMGNGTLERVLGVLFGIVGIVGMLSAYPVYRSVFNKTKEKYTPKILELTEELSNEREFITK